MHTHTHGHIDSSIQNEYRTMGKTDDGGEEKGEEKFAIFLQTEA